MEDPKQYHKIAILGQIFAAVIQLATSYDIIFNPKLGFFNIVILLCFIFTCFSLIKQIYKYYEYLYFLELYEEYYQEDDEDDISLVTPQFLNWKKEGF